MKMLEYFVADNVLYYGTLAGLFVLLCVIVIFSMWQHYKKKLIANLEALETDTKNVTGSTKEDNKIEDVKTTDAKLELETLLDKMKTDLENQKQEAINYFEAEQEERSFISYQELKKAAVNPVLIEEEEPPLVTMNDLIYKEESPSTFKEEMKAKLTQPLKNIASKPFQKTQFISPVYGILEDETDYPKIPSFRHDDLMNEIYQQEQTSETKHDDNIYSKTHIEVGAVSTTIQALEEENRRNDEFLNALKEFRKNL